METSLYYAPVLISTLNRFEHFKRCLESLECCTGADKTDVYVGLDYPPAEKYVKGWKLIDEYLKGKESHNSFRNLYVRRRDHNCGIAGPGSNMSLLTKEIKEITDRYILTEDDNEFSPCFLEYMNKALEKYKDDERVICVCGYTPFNFEGKYNVFFSHTMFAWGVGRWIEKSKNVSKYRNLEAMEDALKNIRTSMRIYRYRPVVFNRVMDQVLQNKQYGDISHTFYCVLYDKYCIYPAITLVRNHGNDGTGVHCKKVDNLHFVNREISQELGFELDDAEIVESDVIKKNMRREASKQWYGNIAILIRYFVWRLTKLDIFVARSAKILNTAK